VKTRGAKAEKGSVSGQMTMFGTEESEETAAITKTLSELNLSMMTPIDALNLLYQLQEQVTKRTH
ncbi:MAG: hypothetical protein ACI4QX_01625, partial [Lachnospiraceae bacterium]